MGNDERVWIKAEPLIPGSMLDLATRELDRLRAHLALTRRRALLLGADRREWRAHATVLDDCLGELSRKLAMARSARAEVDR